tara:strand:+ start:6299 stop:6847 length:549 start_codon:yes stop_codon:yes gene_type:complete
MGMFNIPKNFLNVYTTGSQAIQINKIILFYSHKNSIITDATAGIGGNSYYFCKQFKYVNSVENNFNIISTLTRNIEKFKNKTIYNSTYITMIPIIKQDIVFLDPPWGGDEYKKINNLDLYIDNINVMNIINSLYNYTNLVALKVPKNYNTTTLNYNFWKNKIYNIRHNDKILYNLIIFYKRT